MVLFWVELVVFYLVFVVATDVVVMVVMVVTVVITIVIVAETEFQFQRCFQKYSFFFLSSYEYEQLERVD